MPRRRPPPKPTAAGVTLFDVIVLNKDPAEEDAPTVLFPAKDVES
jgi:hypothetical protein